MAEEQQRVIVRVGGEMDIDRAPLLQEALHTVITQSDCPDEIVVDLAELAFCDSSGLNALSRPASPPQNTDATSPCMPPPRRSRAC
ncbi:STAS domain-containing protein [Streptomyces goshikiensis]|uniref:STAS domain-containing protein n=1 Tax=Streptomyces goshikiensis TaxID=1942 RepID=UPI0036AB188A